MIDLRLPRSLFGRTALLITATFTVYLAVAAVVVSWAVIQPSAQTMGRILAERVREAQRAGNAGRALPDGIEWLTDADPPPTRAFAGLAFRYYLDSVRTALQRALPGSRAVVVRTAGPSEIWVRAAGSDRRWLRVNWQATRPEAPYAALLMLVAGAALAIATAWITARRLAGPLAALATAAGRVADGQVVAVDTEAGPTEVRELATAFDAMARRLNDLESQRELMLAGMSHDLRTPLARLRVAAELLEPPGGELAAGIGRDIDELDRMIGQFLRYVRANYREQPVDAVPDEILRRALAGLQPDSHLEYALDAGTCCRLPEQSLRHIALNLVQNALEYGRPPVIVRTSLRGTTLRLVVEDAGEGLAADEWRLALEPFRQLRGTPGGAHTGLGLAIVARLVYACGGQLEGTRADGRFRVEVSLPVAYQGDGGSNCVRSTR